MIDFYNCGLVGNVCPANYTSCSAGRCSGAPSVQLLNAIPIFTAALNGSVDDRYYNITIPFSITLYNTTSNSVQVTTNGVSFCLVRLDKKTVRKSDFSLYPKPTCKVIQDKQKLEHNVR